MATKGIKRRHVGPKARSTVSRPPGTPAKNQPGYRFGPGENDTTERRMGPGDKPPSQRRNNGRSGSRNVLSRSGGNGGGSSPSSGTNPGQHLGKPNRIGSGGASGVAKALGPPTKIGPKLVPSVKQPSRAPHAESVISRNRPSTPQAIANPKTGQPPGLAKRLTGSKSAKAFTPSRTGVISRR